jgi:hypothetical protein
MAYPKDIPAFRDALLAYSAPAGEIEEKVAEAQAQASVVVQAVGLFNALKGRVAEMQAADDRAGLRLLAGAAHLIAANAWHGLGGEAFDVRDQALAALAASSA